MGFTVSSVSQKPLQRRISQSPCHFQTPHTEIVQEPIIFHNPREKDRLSNTDGQKTFQYDATKSYVSERTVFAR